MWICTTHNGSNRSVLGINRLRSLLLWNVTKQKYSKQEDEDEEGEEEDEEEDEEDEEEEEEEEEEF